MEIGLFIVEKIDGNWDFTPQSVVDAKIILDYKECGLSIDAIKKLLEIERETNSTFGDSQRAYRDVLLHEKKRLKDERSKLKNGLKKVDRRIYQIQHSVTNFTGNGIPVEIFNIIHCPHCDKPLLWENAIIMENTVTSGHGQCTCGYKADIEEGILIAKDLSQIKVGIIDKNRDTLKKMSSLEIGHFTERYRWMLKKLSEHDLKGKFIFEDVINVTCFLNQMIKDLPKEAYYILCDTDIEVVKYHMQEISALAKEYKIIFMVDDGINHPLKKNCLDYVIDYYSSEIYQSYEYPSMHQMIKPYVHEGTYVLGAFSHLKGSRISDLDALLSSGRPSPIRYLLSSFQRNLSENGIRILDTDIDENRADETVLDGGQVGDVITSYLFWGKWEIGS
jgi:DNA-binding transcriptional MerR regulator